jgi:alpha-tubulin suppressor-like RCC1 family protein
MHRLIELDAVRIPMHRWRQRARHRAHYWIVEAAILAFAACAHASTEPPSTSGPSEPPPASRASLSIRDTTLLVDESLAVPVSARDARGQPITNPSITWRSSAPTVAAVDASGRVAALAIGTAILTATMDSIDAQATVSVVPQFTHLATGELHTCGITGRAEVFCWGMSEHGEVGPASGLQDCSARFGPGITCSLVPVRSSNLRAVAITAGFMYTCALEAQGDAYCWGANSTGEAGTGTQSEGPTPKLVVGGHQFTQLVAGRTHTCGITVSRDAYCWGSDRTGALGAGSVSQESCTLFQYPCSRTPRLVAGDHQWAQLSASDRSTCGITTSGDLYCWGLDVGGDDGLYCQSSANLTGCTRTPKHFSEAKRYRAIGVSNVHRCEQSLDGTLECWGANYWGAFGNGTAMVSSATPVAAGGGGPYASFGATRDGVCALTADARARCWGRGTDGQIGNGTMQDALTPADVRGDHRFVALASSASSDVVCGIASTGRAYCWGRGNFGQLGDGRFMSSSEPVLVRLVAPLASTAASLRPELMR